MMRIIFQRRFAALAAVAIFLALTNAAYATSNSGNARDTIKLGMIIPLSGSYSAYGEQTLAGFKYVIRKINASGGIDSFGGAKIELVVVNDASKPAKAASAARQLASRSDICMLAGTILTNEMAAISPIANRAQIPVLSFYAGGTNSKYLYSLGLPYGAGYAQTMVEVIKYIDETTPRDIETAAIMYSNYEAGQAVAEELRKRLKKAGIKVIGAVPLELGGTNYNAALTELNSMDPDVVTGLVTTHAGVVLNQARYEVGSDLLFVGGTGGFASKTVWNALGDSAAKEVLTNNTVAITMFDANAQKESLQKFVKNARSADLDVPVGQNFVQGAQSARVIQKVLELAGNCKTKNILHAFDTMVIPSGSDKLYLAKRHGINFDPETRMVKDTLAIAVQWNKDGTQEVVWPEGLASGELNL